MFFLFGGMKMCDSLKCLACCVMVCIKLEKTTYRSHCKFLQNRKSEDVILHPGSETGQ